MRIANEVSVYRTARFGAGNVGKRGAMAEAKWTPKETEASDKDSVNAVFPIPSMNWT
jgi:hypothetical protein